MAISRVFEFCLAVVLLAGTSPAAEQTLKHLYPAAGTQGTTAPVTAVGKVDPWPPQVWVDAPGITFKPTATTGKFDVEIAKDAPSGPHLVRIFSDQGVSEPRFFIVSSEPELLDTEPNDNFRSPQQLSALPSTVSGRLDKSGDVDSFAVTLKKGQTLVASLEGYVLGSTFDGMLRIVTPDGTPLAFNHDGRTFDPFLAWEAPSDGVFIVQVMGFAYPANAEVRLTGGDTCVYRLHLTAGPFVLNTKPLAVQRGKKTAIQLAGWNLSAKSAELDGTQFGPKATRVELPIPGVASEEAILISDVTEGLERESNDTISTAQPLDIPSAITGCIDRAGDEDCFAFAALKQHVYELKLIAARVGSPLDAWMKIEDKDGKELARNDDAIGGRDPQLTWTAPSDGLFRVAIGDLTHRGDEDFIYRIEIADAVPSVTASVADHAVSLAAGKSAEIKVTAKRVNGSKSKLLLSAKNLPEGVSAPEAEIPENANEVTVKLIAGADAKPASQPFQLTLREADSGKEQPVRYWMTTTSENNGVPQGYSDLVIDSTEQLWLTVSSETPRTPQ